MISNADIIVFCEHLASDRIGWYIPTKIKGVSWHESTAMMQSEKNRISSKSVTIRVPNNAVLPSGRKYIDAEDYNRLPSDNQKNYWTLQPGISIVMKLNAVSEAEFDENEEYEYPDIQTVGVKNITVSEYADNTDRGSDDVKHIRIGGV